MNRRTMKKLNQMLDAAIDGSFVQQNFDESMLSSVESKLAKYLAASEVSAKNITAERDKIKTLISDISHQTKTPIANILLYSELLAEKELSDEARQCVSAMHQQAEKLSFLITALMKLSQLETGVLTLSPVKAQLMPMLDTLRVQYPTVSFKPTTETAVFDPKWTAEAVGNVIDNAIKYTPQGGEIIVSVCAYELFCRIDVTDAGIGISEQEQAKIFTRFYRSPHVSNRKGVGIGLYLTRQILAQQGGYIKVCSALEKGSTFSLFLPR